MSVQFENILYPTDFSKLSLAALSYARDLAEVFGARLHCLDVLDVAYQYWSAMGPESIPVGPPPEEMVEIGQTRMERFRTEHLAGLTKEPVTHVAIGRPFTEIIGYARKNDVRLIVLSTHGRGAIAQMLLGSTTEKVVRKAPCAVLTIRAQDAEFVMP